MKKRMVRAGKSLLAMTLGILMVGGAIGMSAKNGIAISEDTDTSNAEAYVDNTDWSAVFHDLLTGDVTYNPDLSLEGLKSNWPEPGEPGFVDNGQVKGDGKTYAGARFLPGNYQITPNLNGDTIAYYQAGTGTNTGVARPTVEHDLGFATNWAEQTLILSNGKHEKYHGYIGEKLVDLHYSETLGRSVLKKTQDDYIESFPVKDRTGAGWYGVLNGVEFKPGETSVEQLFAITNGNEAPVGGKMCFYESGKTHPFRGNLLTDENTVIKETTTDGKVVYQGSILYREPSQPDYDMSVFSVNVTDGDRPETGAVYDYGLARLDVGIEGLDETVKLMGGIGRDSSFEDVMNVYGRPDYAAYNFLSMYEAPSCAGWHSILGYLDNDSKYFLRIEFVNNKIATVGVLRTDKYLDITKKATEYLMEHTYNDYLNEYAKNLKAELVKVSGWNMLGGDIPFSVDNEAPQADIQKMNQQAVNFISAYEYVCKDRVLNKLTINGVEYTAKPEDVVDVEFASYKPYSDMENEEQKMTAIRLRLEQWKQHDFNSENDPGCSASWEPGCLGQGFDQTITLALDNQKK